MHTVVDLLDIYSKDLLDVYGNGLLDVYVNGFSRCIR